MSSSSRYNGVWTPGLLLATMIFAAGPAEASKPRLRLERVDASKCSEGTVDAFVVEVELEGTLRRRPAEEHRLTLEGRALPAKPVKADTFARSGVPLHLALVIQANDALAEAMGSIRSGAVELIRRMPARTVFTVVTYDEKVRRLVTSGKQQEAQRAVDGLETTGVTVDLALTEALRAALSALGPARAGHRRLLVVVSDGLDRSPRRDLFRSLGTRARHLQVPIHPVAFSPIDERGPLLNLGEIAKRSHGTFRWARKDSSFRGEFANLAREINEQWILTFEVPGSASELCTDSTVIEVRRGKLRSNPVKMAVEAGTDEARPTGRSPLVWIAGLIGLLLLAGILVVATRWLLKGTGRGAPPSSSS